MRRVLGEETHVDSYPRKSTREVLASAPPPLPLSPSPLTSIIIYIITYNLIV
jgi:hypothetical protein